MVDSMADYILVPMKTGMIQYHGKVVKVSKYSVGVVIPKLQAAEQDIGVGDDVTVTIAKSFRVAKLENKEKD